MSDTDIEKPHLSKWGGWGTVRDHGPNEWFCLACLSSVTVDAHNHENEYGHRRGCNRTVTIETAEIDGCLAPTEDETCRRCGDVFKKPKHTTKEYCNDECYRAAKRERNRAWRERQQQNRAENVLTNN